MAGASISDPNFASKETAIQRSIHITAPDCVQRRVLAINGSMPGPAINVTTGDSLEVTVINNMPTEEVTMHWHGIKQTSTPWEDGVGFCPIAPGSSYTYRFSVDKHVGTCWYHAHMGMERTAGSHGIFIISEKHKRDYPFHFDEELPFLVGDWVHSDETYSSAGLAYVANSVLLNGIGRFNCDAGATSSLDSAVACAPGQGALGIPSGPICGATTIAVEAGKKYLLRVVNVGSKELLRVSFQNHTLTIVQAEGGYTEPLEVLQLQVLPGQSYNVILHANQAASAYWFTAQSFMAAAPICALATNAPECPTLVTGTLLYRGSNVAQPASSPPGNSPEAQEAAFLSDMESILAFDAAIVMHPAHVEPLPTATRTITVGVTSSFDGTTPVFLLDRITGVLPSTPVLHATYFGVPLNTNTTSVAMQAQGDPYSVETFGTKNTPIYDVALGEAVLIVFQNSLVTLDAAQAATNASGLPTGNASFNYTGLDSALLATSIAHCWHLHGHDFWVLGAGLGLYDPEESPKGFNLVNPIKRNAVSQVPLGWTAILYVADNPGAWLLHCHFDQHLMAGMFVVILEGQDQIPPPPDDITVCGDLESLAASKWKFVSSREPPTEPNEEPQMKPAAPSADGRGPPLRGGAAKDLP
eukprot:jgi/Mesen1/5986/ME000302S04984